MLLSNVKLYKIFEKYQHQTFMKWVDFSVKNTSLFSHIHIRYQAEDIYTTAVYAMPKSRLMYTTAVYISYIWFLMYTTVVYISQIMSLMYTTVVYISQIMSLMYTTVVYISQIMSLMYICKIFGIFCVPLKCR